MLRAAVILLAALALTAPALAQRADREVSEADKRRALKQLADGDAALARGDKLMKKGKMEDALAAYEAGLAAYQAALAAFPSAKIYFPIAQAEQKLGRFVDALGHYQRVLAEAKDLPGELERQIKTAMAEVKRNLAGLELTVEPAGAAVALDGDALGTAPLDGPRYTEPGQHTLTVTLDGYTPVEEQIDLAPGRVVPRQVVLKRVPLAAAGITAKRQPAPLEPEPGPPPRAGLYILIGTATALAATATITGLAAAARQDTFSDASLSGSEREAARSSGRKLAIATDVLGLGAIAVGAYATYYYLKVYRPRRDAHEDALAARPDLLLSPWAVADGAGVAVSGGF